MELANNGAFKAEVAEAAVHYMGQRAINHQRYTECRSGPTKPECMEVGMTEVGFDCSGLAIRSICDVLGLETDGWDPDFRHVRQMPAAMNESTVMPVEPGDVVLFGKRFVKGSESNLVITHAGVAVDSPYYRGGRMIHAQNFDFRVSNGLINNPGEIAKYIGKVDPGVLAARALGLANLQVLHDQHSY